MAGAQPGVRVLNLEPNIVPKSLVAGEKVFKWDEVGKTKIKYLVEKNCIPDNGSSGRIEFILN